MGDTEKKILAGLGLVALLGTGAGIAGIGPLAGMLGGGGAAGAAGGAGTAAASGGLKGFGALLGKSAAQGAGSSLVGAGLSAITPEQKMTSVVPGQVPQMEPMQDPFTIFQQIMRQGGRV